ncbi:ParM/StbA family protein [Solibacillus merdavium]|uniref:ParM/StbA family protein n=1 Tax=Solibacillus merdavium TaxID=2762218 RepID=A0ABR8XRL2_9BACL|nr:ParM/StbA family protein [Solibacillus merdavium]MBD8034587.1 ParM/StbA family protein [Solibacillus merdavium]
MKPKVLIAVDSGKYGTKAILLHNNKEHYVYFRTKMQEVTTALDIDVPAGSYVVKYNGKTYIIGNMVDESFSSYDLSKEKDIHKLCIYVAIAELLKQANINPSIVDLKVAVNIPISAYKDATTKKRYLEFIENFNNPIMIEVNGVPFIFELHNTIAVFEGVGAIFHDVKASKNVNTTVIDIGGLNATLCQFDSLTPNFDSMVVSNNGCNILKGKIGRMINEKFNVAVASNDLERIIHDGFLMSEGAIISDSHHLIEQLKDAHFQEIISFAKSRGYTFNNTNICFCGGGALLLHNCIKEYFPHAHIVVNPQFCNVKSFLSILKIKNNL